MKSESTTNLVKAVIKVMAASKGIDKSLTVGSGNNSYKGVADKDVKVLVNDLMVKNGLSIFPVEIEPKTTIERWQETYNGNTKTKQQVFTEVVTTYILAHESGEYITIKGYGHGIDTQDKAAGKATTYAMKYALLYSFVIPTGHIDDTDAEHSDAKEVPPTKPQPKAKPELKFGTPEYAKAVEFLQAGNKLDKIKLKYSLPQDVYEELSRHEI